MVQESSIVNHGVQMLNETQLPAKKRARRTKPNSGPSKRLRGKRGALKGLINMPFDIFAEIAYFLTPADLVALLWSSKFLRSVLLQCSAAIIWRRAANNIPTLPQCPSWMSEPQYAVLMFMKCCTLCGAATAIKPDPYLFVRLCKMCRKNNLRQIEQVTQLDRGLIDYSDSYNFLLSGRRRYRIPQPIFGLSHAIDELVQQHELESAKGPHELADWEERRRRTMLERRECGDLLLDYLDWVEISRSEELDGLRKQREDMVIQRLEALGWEKRDMTYTSEGCQQWQTLVSVPKPLTEQAWSKVLLKLVPTLENNRPRRIAAEKLHRRSARRRRIDELLKNLQSGSIPHPGELVVDALAAEPSLLSSFRFKDFFPNTTFVLTWDWLVDLGEWEISIDEVETEFVFRKDRIEREILRWREEIERHLAVEFDDDINHDTTDVVLMVSGNRVSPAALSGDQRLLLRADTIFKDTASTQINPNKPFYYPHLITTHYRRFSEYSSPLASIDRPAHLVNIDLSRYKRNIEAQVIAKRLLKDLGTPDVTRAELLTRSSGYICGRCTVQVRKTWDEMVDHYITESAFFDDHRQARGYPIFYSIVYRNEHDFWIESNQKPLIRLATGSPPTQIQDTSMAHFYCYLCLATGRRAPKLKREHALAHLQDAHDAPHAEEKVHYGKQESFPLTKEWADNWDVFNAAEILSMDHRLGYPAYQDKLIPDTPLYSTAGALQ